MTRIALIVGSIALALALGPLDRAQAAEQPYCAANTGHETTYVTCGFATFSQCQQEAQSMRGWCYPNPYFRGGAERPDRAPRSEPAPRRERR